MLESIVRRLRETGGPVVLEDGRVDISSLDFSSVDMYLRCPKQWHYRHVQGLKSPPSIALAEGIAHHASAETDNKSKMSKGKMLTAPQAVEIFMDRFRSTTKEFEKECEELKVHLDWEEETEDDVFKRGKKMQTQYLSDISPTIKPVEVEGSFSREAEVDGQKFVLFGQSDVDTKDTIIDYKASKRAKTQRDVDDSLQLTLYSWAKRRKKVSYVTFIKEKAAVSRVDSGRHPGNWAWGLQVVASVVDSIRRGAFPMTNPSSIPPPWHCSPRFCGYWKRCRGALESPQRP